MAEYPIISQLQIAGFYLVCTAIDSCEYPIWGMSKISYEDAIEDMRKRAKWEEEYGSTGDVEEDEEFLDNS
jgi:hypothetical protein